ncbi:MAG: AMP-binding protein [Candidatus Hydrogenedentes bacterium]|nr:AMP-binding protein [Candidatus Hydrogenedentota bacterium]
MAEESGDLAVGHDEVGAFGHPARKHIAGGYYTWLVLFTLFGLGYFAGFFDVPLAAAIQHRAPDHMKGGVIATTNMLTFVGMAFSSIVFLALGSLNFSTYAVFAVIGLMSAAMGAYICMRLPHLLLRSILWMATTILTRLKVYGRDKVPPQGGALWVANHLSIVDCLALIASTDRDVYFVVGQDALEADWIRRLARGMRLILFDPRGDEREMQRVVGEIQRVIALGNVVCVNCEARHAAEGTVVPWHKDYFMLLKGLDAPLIPVYLCRLWQILYIFENKQIQWRWPRYRHRIVVAYGAPVAPDTPAHAVRETVLEVGMAAYLVRRHRFDLLHRGFVHAARQHPRRIAISDSISGELSYFKTLVGSIVFARKLKQILDGQRMVGVLLPPSIGSALTNIALQLLGRVPVNLNYTASAETMASCALQCGITQVLTSKKLLERLPLEVPGQSIFLEDVREQITGKDRIVAMLLALLAPVRVLEKLLGAPYRTEKDLATIIFSSGSEGEPKGVMLTHRNLISNIECALESFPHDEKTCLVGFLPFFHSFGFMATLWMPLSRGYAATYHSNPLEPKIIGGLVEKYHGSIMIGTSTLLQSFIRRCTPEQLKSLSFVVCGAEKLAPRVRLAFKEKFGVEPLEGYGTTECTPAVSVNFPDLESPGFFYRATCHGTIGRPLPGQCVKIMDTDTGEEVPLGGTGLLLVKGPNIMQGYLNQPEKTAKVLHDGWYETGDIAALNDEGFITITDRLARFSKIGGEMVPHAKVEETLHGLISMTDQVMAVSSVPDAQKGERLIVLHTMEDDKLEELMSKMDQSGLPNLWIPRANSFYRIEQIPVLGTGKVDIKSIKKLAQALDLGE